MPEIPCPRCCKGRITAFNHVQGGVCFRCRGKGTVLVRSVPAEKKTFLLFGLWLDPEHPNYNNGDWLHVMTIKTTSQATADKRAARQSLKTGIPFRAEPVS